MYEYCIWLCLLMTTTLCHFYYNSHLWYKTKFFLKISNLLWIFLSPCLPCWPCVPHRSPVVVPSPVQRQPVLVVHASLVLPEVRTIPLDPAGMAVWQKDQNYLVRDFSGLALYPETVRGGQTFWMLIFLRRQDLRYENFTQENARNVS